MLDQKFLINKFIDFSLIILIIFIANFSSLYFEQAYRNNTIYFPVDYGYNVKDNPFSQAEYLWGWSNGRWLGAIIESEFFFKHINSLKDLQLSRLIGVILTSLSAYIFYLFILNVNNKNYCFKRALLSGLLFILPGFLYFNFMGAINSQLTVFLVILTGYLFYKTSSIFLYILLFIIFFLCLSNYTPISLLILVFPAYFVLQQIKLDEKVYILKKYLIFVVFSFIFFYIFKTFLLEIFYNIYHGNFYSSEYPFFKNEHPQYKTEFNLSLKHYLKKIFIYFNVWLINDLNLWNIYSSKLIGFVIFLIIYKYYLLKNFKKNKTEILIIFIIYIIPIIIWMPFQTTLVPYRGIIGTQIIIFIILSHITLNIKNRNFRYFYALVLVAMTVSTYNSYINAKGAFLEFNFVKSKLLKINEKTKHIHIIQPKVGTGFLGNRSIELEFNRPSNLTWQETTRYLNAAYISLKKNRKIYFHDCETTVVINKNKVVYNMKFPTMWDIEKCINDLPLNNILVTWEHPHQFDQSNLNFMSRYNELHKGMSLDKTKHKSTLFIDFNELMKKHKNQK